MRKNILQRKYFFILILLMFFLYSDEKLFSNSKPSPYFVHDAEVYFWDLFIKTTQLDHISKLGLQAEITGSFSASNFFIEAPLHLPKKNETFTPLSELKTKRDIISIMIGYGTLFQSDGHPNHKWTNYHQNVIQLPFLGVAYSSKILSIRLGHLYGMYGLSERIYDNVSKSYVDASGYFNYSSTSWKDDASGGHPMLKSLSKDYTAGDTYNRIHLSGEFTLPWFTIPFGKATNLGLKSSYDYYGIKTKFLNQKYLVNIHVSRSEDLEGDKKFGIIQLGLEQRLILTRTLGALSFFRINVNYTKFNSTALTDFTWTDLKEYDSDRYFYECEFSYGFMYFSMWYNLKNDYGYGFGYVAYQQRLINYYFRVKYNPFTAFPVYKRSLNKDGWSFEIGASIDFYGSMETGGWL